MVDVSALVRGADTWKFALLLSGQLWVLRSWLGCLRVVAALPVVRPR